MNKPLHPSPEPVSSGTAWHLRLVRFARWLHKWTGVLLAIVLIVIALSGAFIAFKNQLNYLQPETQRGTNLDSKALLSPAQIAEIVIAQHYPEARDLSQINRIEWRPGKGIYKVRLESNSIWRSPREIQLDASTGVILSDGVRGDQLWMDIHSFAVFGEYSKLILMLLSGLILFWLALSGIYLFFYPLWFRAQKRKQQV